MTLVLCLVLLGLIAILPRGASAATAQKHYYAHDAVEDADGVLAPWHRGQNGQCDFRVRVAAETLKRYPWTEPGKAAAVVPAYVFNGHWSISPEGVIGVPELRDWDNGDLGQRAAYVLSGFVDYYRYSGDAAAIAHITLLADALLDHCLTPADHPWPHFLISVPTKGVPYGQANPHGMIQLDIVAETGLALLRAYQLAGNERWFGAARHWADLLAEKRERGPGLPPWNRYANPEDVAWEDQQTGGVVFLLAFFDELIRLGYEGEGKSIVEARDAGRAYLREVLLPKWTVDDTWGRNYWDWPDPVQAENVTEFTVRYLIEHPEVFPNWEKDARNILSLFLNRTSVAPNSNGEVFSGAWAYPESSGCCGRSLWYGPMELGPVWAQYGAAADSAWAREIARRQMILATYDGHETGVVEDNIDGGPIVAGDWFKIAHPMALKHVLNAMAWQPEVFGANRENHLMRSSSVISSIVYEKGRVSYDAYDAPADSVDVLRLSFNPETILSDGKPLPLQTRLEGNGYTVQPLSNGDCVVTLRRDGARNIVVTGDDPQGLMIHEQLSYTGDWAVSDGLHESLAKGSFVSCAFSGNQVRLIGDAEPDGGLADIYLDGTLQRVPLDAWSPSTRQGHIVYYRNGLENGPHELKVVVRGAGNPTSSGAAIRVRAVQYSAATGDAGSGSGGGPTETQRMIFGYAGREDHVDSAGNTWRPATEVVCRLEPLADVVARTWWTARRRLAIENTGDPELYRYGMHAREFWTNLTVGPGSYYVRLKFAETRSIEPKLRAVTVLINGEAKVTNLDVAATAGGMNKAVDLVFSGIRPKNGVIELRFSNGLGGEAIVQALEAGQGDGGVGAAAVTLP